MISQIYKASLTRCFFCSKMKLIYYLVLFILLSSCGRQFKLSRTGSAVDTSYIYSLPYVNGKSPLLIQGYNSWFSHKGRLGLDFKLKKGTPIHAARGGVVTSVREEFTGHGLNKKYLRKANHIIIRHNDGSQAMYAHLQKDGVIPKVGDVIQEKQLIGYSGNTGYSALPHLHFIVWGPTPKGRAQLPTRFRTKKGAKYLKPGRRYTSI